jgi:hypothetical protein
MGTSSTNPKGPSPNAGAEKGNNGPKRVSSIVSSHDPGNASHCAGVASSAAQERAPLHRRLPVWPPCTTEQPPLSRFEVASPQQCWPYRPGEVRLQSNAPAACTVPAAEVSPGRALRRSWCRRNCIYHQGCMVMSMALVPGIMVTANPPLLLGFQYFFTFSPVRSGGGCAPRFKCQA